MIDTHDPLVDAIRRFNRFYTQRIGVLHEGLLASRHSLTEVRVLYELSHRRISAASDIAEALALDPGYLSRILRGFEREGWLLREPCIEDARRHLLWLTPAGQAAFDELDQRSSKEVAAMLDHLPAQERGQLVAAMRTIEELLGARIASAKVQLRSHRPGDMGWIVHRHGALYAQEFGWDERFEALVAEIVAAFIRDFNPQSERCWIAERDGAIVGSVFLVRQSDHVAKLRLLYVEPTARGLGLGGRLVDECIHFARQVGYSRLTLWTNDVLVSARRIYEAAGFRLVNEEPHHSFGKDLVGQTWELDLT